MPNPMCRWCHGTGQITLLLTVVPCECATRASTPGPSWLPPSLVLDARGGTFTGPLGAAFCVRPTHPMGAALPACGVETYLAELTTAWTSPLQPPLDQLGVPPAGSPYPGTTYTGLRLHTARPVGFLRDVLPHCQNRLYVFELVWRR